MKTALVLTLALAALVTGAAPALAQDEGGLGEVLVTANRQNMPYAQANRPVVGLLRRADAAVMPLSIISDSRDAEVRKQEIHTVLAAAIDKAAAAGFELVFGNVQLNRVTKANFKDLQFQYAGRADTSRVDLLVKGKLEGTAAATQDRLLAFQRSLKGSGRATVQTGNGITLTVVNPDQYRNAIVKLVADHARQTAAIFGPEFTFNLSGIDGQVSWTQASPTEVFLYLPYSYTIRPK